MIRSELIATFITIVDAGSLNAAAGKLRLSRSVISERLNALETDLGIRLLIRSTHGLSLTRAGEIFLGHARELAGAMAAARDAMAESGGALSGALRLATPASLAFGWLAPALVDFLETHQHVSLEISASDRQVDIVQDGFDAAIRGGRLPDSALMARKITTGRRVVVCSPAYKARYGVPQSLAELRHHCCVVYRNRRAARDWTFNTPDGVRSALVTGRFEADDGAVLRAAVVEGAGICLLPTFMVSQDLIDGRLLIVDLGVEPETDTIAMVYPKANAALPRLQALIDRLRDALGDPSPWDRDLAAAGLVTP